MGDDVMRKNLHVFYIAVFMMLLGLLNMGYLTEIVSAGPYSGPDYYVSDATGDDINNGSFDYPWKTVQHAMDTLTAGQTVYIMAGTYLGYNTPWSANNGTADNWITYTNYQDDVVIIDGSNDNDSVDALFWFYNQSYIRVSGLTLCNSSCYGIWVEGANCHNFTFDNCTIYNTTASAIISYTNGIAEDILIENNTIYDCMNGWNDNETPPNEVITVSNVDRFIVRNNRMWDMHKISIDAKNQASHGQIYGNRINITPTRPMINDDSVFRWTCSGIYVDAYDDDASNISVFNNILWGNSTGYIMGTEIGGTLHMVLFYNNIYNGSGHAFQINNHTSEPGSHLKTDCGYINNLAYGCSICFQLTDANSSFSNFTFRNNILAGTKGINIGSGQCNLSYQNVDHNLFNVASSDYYGSNSVNGTPGFVDAGDDFHLLITSIAIDNGSSYGAPLTDFDGLARPQGEGFDIGPFEFDFEEETPEGPTYELDETTDYVVTIIIPLIIAIALLLVLFTMLLTGSFTVQQLITWMILAVITIAVITIII